MSDSIPNWISHTVTGIQGAEYHLVLLKHKIFDLQGYWISKLKCLADCLKQRRWKAKSKKHWKASLILSNSGVRVRLLLHSFFSLPVLSDPILHLPYRYEYDSSNIGYAFLGTLQCSKIKKKLQSEKWCLGTITWTVHKDKTFLGKLKVKSVQSTLLAKR